MEVRHSTKGEWRSVSEVSGGQCVQTSRGTIKELRWSAASLASRTGVSWIAQDVCSGSRERLCGREWGSMLPKKEKDVSKDTAALP